MGYSIKDWQKRTYDVAVDRGWHDKGPASFGDICSLLHSEISEAFEEYRKGHAINESWEDPEKPGKMLGIPTELADIVIRCLEFAHTHGIDLEPIMEQKHQYNSKREYRHGNKIV